MSGRRSWCTSCLRTTVIETNDLYTCCTSCGKVVAENIYSDDVQFKKNAAGQMQKDSRSVRIESENSSRERTLNKAKEFILEMIQNMGIGDGEFLAIPSVRFYEIAVEKDFLRGRRAEQVAAACLYIACREKNRPFLLIEFSEYLRINVYVLGAVFLQLCKVLHLQEHAIVRKLVDPSLFIHRFAHGLLGERNHEIEKTALRIMTSMKRDWMQTGRKPSGLCGAALYISAISYGHKIPKTDVIKVVHICEATLNKRLIEFEETASGSLTIEEFNQKAEEIENVKGKLSKEGELLCEHKNKNDISHFAHGLCENCYIEFIKISGGLDGGSDPPAFQRAEKQRLAKALAEANADKNSLLDVTRANSSEGISETEGDKNSLLDVTRANSSEGISGTEGDKNSLLDVTRANSSEGISGTGGDKNSLLDVTRANSSEGISGTEGDDESDNFSDIDDEEVNGYLHNEEETEYKKTIWEKVNWEYLEEQAQKAAAGLLNVPKPKKERQKKKTDGIARTAAEAAHQMLSKKRVSSKLNHDRLKELFDEPVVSDSSPKRIRTDSSFPEKENQEKDDEDNEDDYERNTYEEYQDDTYDYNEDEYEEFDDGLF